MISSLPRTWRLISAELTWPHHGYTWRVTVWPEIQFQRRSSDDWTVAVPDEEVFASAAKHIRPEAWDKYMEYLPQELRTFLGRYRFTRISTLFLVTQCPSLLADLEDTPAVAAFLANHRFLRMADECRWSEIAAIYERNGIYGLMEWLGLPASRQTIAILRNIADPDVPKRLLDRIRELLWEPTAITALARCSAMSDRDLTRMCHALAA